MQLIYYCFLTSFSPPFVKIITFYPFVQLAFYIIRIFFSTFSTIFVYIIFSLYATLNIFIIYLIILSFLLYLFPMIYFYYFLHLIILYIILRSAFLVLTILKSICTPHMLNYSTIYFYKSQYLCNIFIEYFLLFFLLFLYWKSKFSNFLF